MTYAWKRRVDRRALRVLWRDEMHDARRAQKSLLIAESL